MEGEHEGGAQTPLGGTLKAAAGHMNVRAAGAEDARGGAGMLIAAEAGDEVAGEGLCLQALGM